ncbi:MAG: PrsW family intramembrane metalloprotease [Candidatus Staskawiczbacteria bacterium]|nr:PrsW family intramembrane metalloprotease [Candidatus Staskawiczbacteria bacterium]
MDYSIIIYIILGLLPSLTWLFYYLTKDLHPEPKRMIIKVFLWGAFITLPVFFVQIGLTKLLDMANVGHTTLVWGIIYWFIIISFSEEIFKYLVIRVKVVDSHHLDEPVDVMLYMVVSALGFAAVENILYLFAPMGQMSIDELIGRALLVTFIRFIGATFLHTLCSAVIGYFLAISFCHVKSRHIVIVAGIIMATVLHGLYDFFIIKLPDPSGYIVPAITILILAVLVFVGFEKLKKMKSICKI